MSNALLSSELEKILYEFGPDRRHTQDSPVLIGVWQTYLESRGKPIDLLLIPNRKIRPGELALKVRTVFKEYFQANSDIELVYNQSTVLIQVSFEQMLLLLVPFSQWWRQSIFPYLAKMKTYSLEDLTKSEAKRSSELLLKNSDDLKSDLSRTALWWMRLIGTLALWIERGEFYDVGYAWLEKAKTLIPNETKHTHADELFQISVNRDLEPACYESVCTVKADAANLLFSVDTSKICWAVLDSGIDANHEVFQNEDGSSRVIETYDFTRVRRLLRLASTPGNEAEKELATNFGLSGKQADQFRNTLAVGGDVDWHILREALAVKPDKLAGYTEGISAHGTHVAGILGGCRKADAEEGDFCGMCPQIRIIDVRILDKEGNAGNTEFEIIAALQFIRYLNSSSDDPYVHGVNLSIQLQHNPRDYATGRTPVCDECNRLVARGVVVVAAAGNLGIEPGTVAASTTAGSFRGISIADPGNAESVITVGSTHRKRPHTYGVSYFSSRGPTGDGRQKPDLVAPGEKILGPIPGGGYVNMEGTSMAAPHVSGAAALLLARHPELIGNAARVKQILCDTCTDLGRLRDYQGAGLVDVLRALQSI